MNQGPDAQLSTPLEDALENLPQAEPPAGLQAACLKTLDQAGQPHPRWEAWRQFVAAAAVVVMILGAGNMGWMYLNSHSREKARYTPPMVAQYGGEGGKAGKPMAPPPPGAVMGPAAQFAGPGGPPAGPSSADATKSVHGPSAANGPAARSTQVQGWFGQTPAPVRERLAQQMKQANAPGAPPQRATTWSTAPSAADSIAVHPTSPPATGAQPWNDQSDTRRKVTERTIELETPKVEETYKQAVTLIEKAGGYVTQEDLAILDHGRGQAHVHARIPVDQFDGVIAQVRELGHLVMMTGQSQDETEDYQAEGAGIRDLGAREEALATRVQTETNKQTKAELARELESVRAQLQGSKQALKSLHKSVSYAQLSLTISEAKGLQYVVKHAAEAALPLAFSLSLILVPLLVLALIWKRRG